MWGATESSQKQVVKLSNERINEWSKQCTYNPGQNSWNTWLIFSASPFTELKIAQAFPNCTEVFQNFYLGCSSKSSWFFKGQWKRGLWELRDLEPLDDKKYFLSRVYNEPIQRPAPSWLVSLIGKCTAPVSQRSRVRIPYKPEFFSRFLFAIAKVVPITAMICFHIIKNTLSPTRYITSLSGVETYRG